MKIKRNAESENGNGRKGKNVGCHLLRTFFIWGGKGGFCGAVKLRNIDMLGSMAEKAGGAILDLREKLK